MSYDATLARDAAIDVWIAGYLRLRTPIDGASPGTIGGLAVARYPKPVRPAQAEFFVREPAPERDAAVARASGLGRHWLTVFERDVDGADDYAAFGYSLSTVEYLMVCPLAGRRFDRPAAAQRISDAELAGVINGATGTLTVVPEHFADPAISIWGIAVEERLAAWGANVWTRPDMPYVSRVFTVPHERRRGLATLVMRALLDEAAKRGATHSVLSASEMARTLYGQLEYAELARMRIWRSELDQEGSTDES